MVFQLVFDVILHLVQVGFTHRKQPVTILPMEVWKMFFADPFAGIRLDLGHEFAG
jgi:hypothetical protein